MRLFTIVAAAIGALLITRRKSLKDDAQKVQSAASDSARKLNERVRDRGTAADDTDAAEDAEVVDLTAEVQTAGENAVPSAGDTEIEKVSAPDAD